LRNLGNALQSPDGDVEAAMAEFSKLGIDYDEISAAGARNRNRTEMELSLRNEISNLVQDQADLDDNWNEIQETLRDTQNVAQFSDLVLTIDPTPEGRKTEVFLSGVDDYFAKVGLEFASPEQEFAVGEALLNISKSLGPDGFENEAVQAEIINLANQFQLDPGELILAIENAGALGVVARDEAANAQTAKHLKPGSDTMAYLLYQAASDIGLDPETAALFAKSGALHRIIDVKSQGKAGLTQGGDQVGIGGLPRRVVDALLAESGRTYDDIKGDMLEEAKVLLMYIQIQYGDPTLALQDFATTGDWGLTG
jgi:hypothetical protein